MEDVHTQINKSPKVIFLWLILVEMLFKQMKGETMIKSITMHCKISDQRTEQKKKIDVKNNLLA